MKNFRTVAVLMGGTSSEREVSLTSGRNVVEALSSLGTYDVVPVRLDSDDLGALTVPVDAAFLALHGGYGENGGVQADLDARGIPYTGPGAATSRITIDKIATKKCLDAAGVRNAPWAVVTDPDAACPLPFPCVVKPPKDGSSVGISRVRTAAEWPAALALALKTDAAYGARAGLADAPCALVEEFVPGREWTVGVLAGEALPVIEIRAPADWYGYDEKYHSDATRYAFADGPLAVAAQEAALAACRATGVRGVSRVDFRVSPEGELHVLEINTVPGYTAHSLVPKAAAKRGWDFPETCRRILEAADHD